MGGRGGHGWGPGGVGHAGAGPLQQGQAADGGASAAVVVVVDGGVDVAVVGGASVAVVVGGGGRVAGPHAVVRVAGTEGSAYDDLPAPESAGSYASRCSLLGSA